VQLKMGIKRQEWIARKKHLRNQPRRKCRTEQRKMNMRRPPGIVMIAPWIFSRTNGHEAIASFGVGYDPPASREVWIERSIVLIDFVLIASGSVGLPDLDQSIRSGRLSSSITWPLTTIRSPRGFPCG